MTPTQKLTDQMTPEQVKEMLSQGLLYIGREFNLSPEEEAPIIAGLEKMRSHIETAGDAMTAFLTDLIEAVKERSA